MISRWLNRIFPIPTVRGVRGAITVARDDVAAIDAATRELLDELKRLNQLRDEEIVSAFFTLTTDLAAGFPARAARADGWDGIPLICAAEIAVPGALPRCLRILLHVQRVWNSDPIPVYLGDAVALRPDLIRNGIAFQAVHRQHPAAG